MATMARNQPTPEPKPYTAASAMVPNARSCMKSEPPRIEQFTAINGKKIPHLVIQGERGPVTILLLPDEAIDDAVQLEGESINGVLLPVGEGSIAIIGERDEQRGKIQQNVVNSVTWST